MSLPSHSEYENFLLKNLIEDLDSSCDYPKENNFSKFQKNFKYQQEKTSATALSTKSNDDLSVNSPLIQSPTFTKQEIFKHLLTQKSALFLQSIVREMNIHEIDNFHKEIKGHFSDLMMHKNGNYLCSDFFQKCNKKQRIGILHEIYNKIYILSTHEFGTHPLQKLIELSETNEEYLLITSAFSDFSKNIKIAFNPNGSYVIQKIFINVPESKRTNFNLYILSIIPLISKDLYGICICKKFISFSQNKNFIEEIINQIVSNFVEISENKYGNYLIQYIIEFWWDRKEMIVIKHELFKNFYRFSINQFASHIAESYIKMLNFDEKKRLLSLLLRNGTYSILIKNKYGIFVINKLLSYNLKAKMN